MKVDQPAQARIAVRGTFECRNAAGEVIKTIEVSGSIPIEAIEAEPTTEDSHGSDLGE